MGAPTLRVQVSTRRVYALGALAAVLFGYDGGIIGAAILFIPHDLPLPPWQQGVVVGARAMPDTPRSLVRRGHPGQARAVLTSLRGDAALAERELTEITELERQQHNTNTGARLSAPWVRRLLLLGALLAIFQQVTGIGSIVYVPTVLTGFGMSKITALLFGFLNGLLNTMTIAVVVRSKVVDRRGRKPILLAGLAGMSASWLAVGIAALTLPVNSTALFVIAVAAFVVFTNTFSATWGPVLWVMLAEIFPLAIRGSAMAIATLFNWLSAFVISLTFPSFVALAGIGTAFIVFAV